MSELLLEILRTKIDPAKLRHISSAKGGEWCSPCPVCGGDDRFRCWPAQDGGAACQQAGAPGTWWCRKCNKGGDLIDLLMYVDGLQFGAACKELHIELSGSARRLRPLRQPKPSADWTPRTWEIPTEKWRKQATKMATETHARLLDSPRALEFLAGRGLPCAAVLHYRLGLLEGEDNTGTCMYRARSAFDLADKQNKDGTRTRKTLWIPRGISIPLWGRKPQANDNGEVHRLRIRRRTGDLRDGDVKFILLEGSGQAPMTLLPHSSAPTLTTWVIVESELDAMAVHFACAGAVGVMASLTNLGKPDAAAHKLLQASPCILVALDFDPPDAQGKRPGAQGWAWWHKHYPQARRWPVPVGKDPGEAFALGLDLAAWVQAALPAVVPARDHGSLGATHLGVSSAGEGAAPSVLPVSAIPQAPGQAPAVRGPARWQGATAATPLHEALLPESCDYPVSYLHNSFAGKSLTPETLIPCPKTPTPWYWLAFENCTKCRGHKYCLLDFVTSPQMLAVPVENTHA